MLGLYTNNITSPTTEAFAVAIFPVATTPAVPANKNASICGCVTGGVTVAIAVLPVNTVKNVDGATVAADTNVTGAPLLVGLIAAQSLATSGIILTLLP
jgi:hypothetical protein